MEYFILFLIVTGIIAAIVDDEPFEYKKKNGEWRAYFKGKPPSYTHTLQDSDGYYVCWDRPIKSKSEVEKVAAEWRKRWGGK